MTKIKAVIATDRVKTGTRVGAANSETKALSSGRISPRMGRLKPAYMPTFDHIATQIPTYLRRHIPTCFVSITPHFRFVESALTAMSLVLAPSSAAFIRI